MAGDKLAIELVLQALEDSNPTINAAAIDGLILLGDVHELEEGENCLLEIIVGEVVLGDTVEQHDIMRYTHIGDQTAHKPIGDKTAHGSNCPPLPALSAKTRAAKTRVTYKDLTHEDTCNDTIPTGNQATGIQATATQADGTLADGHEWLLSLAVEPEIILAGSSDPVQALQHWITLFGVQDFESRLRGGTYRPLWHLTCLCVW